MNENVFNLMKVLLQDGGSLDWNKLASYIEKHNLDIDDIVDNFHMFCEGKFDFDCLVCATFYVSINKFVDNGELADVMRERIYANYLDSFIDLDVFEYCEEHELDISEEDLIKIDGILNL